MIIRPLARIDPMDAAERLAGLGNLAFLDSAVPDARLGRWSYLTADPFAVFRVAGGRAFWNGEEIAPAEGDHRPAGVRALDELRRRLARYREPSAPGLPPFQGGAVGYVAYEFGALLERPPRAPLAAVGIAEAELHLHDVVVAWDHVTGTVTLVSTGWPESEPAARAKRAEARADQIAARLARPAGRRPGPSTVGRDGWSANLGRAGFEAAVATTVEHILNGDIFQANVAESFTSRVGADFDALALHRRLRAVNPAPFAALFDWDHLAVSSSSPERFVRIAGDAVETSPIKGTARRSPDALEDARRAEALLSSEKDRAENVMIVDLMRSDLSRVCRPGSIAVPRLAALESYANVHHLVSTVTGRLEAGRDGLDVVAAGFPGGSITGAPKIAAMEIIAALEGVERGVYCGSIGWIGFDGDADFNIAIRTATIAGGIARFSAGCGITALSDPGAEYAEALAKAERLFAAFAGENGR